MSESKAVATPLDSGTKLARSESGASSTEDDVFPYREFIGELIYLAVCTRPDIANAVNYLSQFNSCYDKHHWAATKRVLRYLKGTPRVGLTFKKTNQPLKGFVDADWANCTNDRRSYTGFGFLLGGNPISWESRKQRKEALSSMEAEYMSLTEAAKEAIYLRRFLDILGFERLGRVTIICDNNGALKLAENSIFHNRSKHIDVRHHYIREVLENVHLEIKYIPTCDMAVDIFTKGLSRPKQRRCLESLGVTDIKEYEADRP